MATFDDFWNKVDKKALGQGMFNIGTGLYGTNAANKELDARMGQARGPLYDQSMALAGTALGRAGNLDPRAAAKEHFNAQRGLLSGVDAKSEADLMRMLHSKGQMGMSSYNPGVEGITPNGTAMNPQMAAYYAARNARDAKMSADSLDAGEASLNNQINRAAALQGTARNTQATGMVGNTMRPNRASQNLEMLKGIGGVLKDSGMLGAGMDWIKDAFKSGFGGGGMLDFETGFGDWWN